MSKLEKKAWELLKQIPDPELNVSLVDLGLIYKVEVKEGKAKVTMTLTTIGCPMYGVIQKTVEEKLMEIKEVQNVEVELTFDPPWTMERLSEEAKLKLGLI
jgi:metal-sulfur cluster biosynthetic enzyme